MRIDFIANVIVTRFSIVGSLSLCAYRLLVCLRSGINNETPWKEFFLCCIRTTKLYNKSTYYVRIEDPHILCFLSIVSASEAPYLTMQTKQSHISINARTLFPIYAIAIFMCIVPMMAFSSLDWTYANRRKKNKYIKRAGEENL